MENMTPKRKILFIISTLTGGGAERALCNITSALPEDVTADILVNYETEKDYPHKGNVISLKMPVRERFSIMYQFVALIYKYFYIRRLKRENCYDACISFMDSANIVNVLTGKKHGKIILSERINLSSCQSAGYRYIVFPLAKKLYQKADYMVSLSKGTAIDLVENFNLLKKQTITIYNGFNIDAIQEKAKEISPIEIERDKFYFISIGRLCKQKGQWHLLKAFCEVVEKHPESRLILCGEGAYSPMLQQMTQQLGIPDKVTFAGFQKNPFAIAAKCDVFVFTSLYEGFGNVMIESMACGLPIISTDYRSGAREILAPDTDYNFQLYDKIEYAKYGILTPVCSGAQNENEKNLEKEERFLAEAMIKLIEEKELRTMYALKSIERAKDFSIDNTVRQWLELI